MILTDIIKYQDSITKELKLGTLTDLQSAINTDKYLSSVSISGTTISHTLNDSTLYTIDIKDAIQSTIGTSLVAGANVSISYDPVTGLTTISASAPSGGSSTFSGLDDVTITAPSNNQLIRYDSSVSKWVNMSLTDSQVLFGGSGGIAQNSLFTYDTVNSILTVGILGTGSNTITTTDIGLLAGSFTTSIYPSSLATSNISFTLPPDVGTSGYILSTDGTGTLSWIPMNAGGIPWIEVTASSTLIEDTGHIINGASTLTLTLPTTIAQGKVIRIVGTNGGWTIAQNTSQQIIFGKSSTTVGTGGALSSTDPTDAVYLLCTTANTTFHVISSIGIITIT